MAANSKNPYDVLYWIEHKVLPSCKTIEHIKSCNRLLTNFSKIYRPLDDVLMYHEFSRIQTLVFRQWR